MNEHEITEALRLQAVGAGAPRLTLDDVRGRARSIRRRRAAAATGGAAAVVAAAVLPLALLVGGDSSPDSLPPADGTPTVVDSDNPVEPDPVRRVDQNGSWLAEGEIHPAHGKPFTPQVEGPVVYVAGLSDGRWVVTTGPGGGASTVSVTDGSGAVLASYDAQDSTLATDDVVDAVSWIGPGGDPQVLLAGTEEPIATGADLDTRISPPAPIEILPGCTAQECYVLTTVFDRSQDDGSTDVAVGIDGSVQGLERLGLRSITDLSQDGALVAGILSVDPNGQEYCSGVVSFATGEQLWEDCDSGRFRFSLDGTKVLGIDAPFDGPNHARVEVLDARTGESLRTPLEGAVFDEAWADADHYVVTLGNEAGETALFRFSLVDEPAEQLGGPVTPEFEGEPAIRLMD